MISVFQKFILLSQCFGFTLLSFGRGEYIKFIRSGSWDPVKVYFFFGVSIFREALLGHQQGPPTTNIAQRFPFQEPRKLCSAKIIQTRKFLELTVTWQDHLFRRQFVKVSTHLLGCTKLSSIHMCPPPKRCFLKLAKHLQVFISLWGDINNVYFDFGSSHQSEVFFKKNVFLEISQISQENTCARVSLWYSSFSTEHLWTTASVI